MLDGKTAVVGLKERRGEVREFPVAATDQCHHHPAVVENARPGSKLFTDCNPAYRGLAGFHYGAVKHSAGEYVRGIVHINLIESFRPLLKRGYVVSSTT